jgi:hypothetical protein
VISTALKVTMKRTTAIAGSFLALALLVSGVAQAGPADPDQESSWWSWIGTYLGGVSYGNGADRIVGSDKLVHQQRSITGVHGIEIRGPINVVLKQAATEKLTVHTDDNLTPLIETPVNDGILVVRIKDGTSFRSKHAVGVTVEVPSLRSIKLLASGDVTSADFETDILEITIRGSGDLRIDGLRAGTVAVLIQGSGDVRLSGTAPKQGYVIEGSGDLDAGELAGRDVAVRIAGSGDAHVWVSQTLSVDINGSGDVHYRGNAAIRKSINGSGELRAD